MDFPLPTQANHTIEDYDSFGFWVGMLAGSTTMLADGDRLTLFNVTTFGLYIFSAARSPNRSSQR